MKKVLMSLMVLCLLVACQQAEQVFNQSNDATIISRESLDDSFYPVYSPSAVSDYRDNYYYYAINYVTPNTQ